jgi:predicted peptidase
MTSRTILKTGLLAGLALCLQIATPHVQLASQQAAAQAGRGRGAAPALDPRVEQRTYLFTDTNEELPYAVFVSSKVSNDKKNPLIVALHGLGGDPNTLLRGSTLDLAEEGGYILVGPMGYNSGGWYGTPYGQGGRGRGANANGPAGAARGGANAARGAAPQNGAGRGRGAGFGGGGAGGTAATDPARVSELSEKDVMNILGMIREEFNVDENRTYLMGHSMGGAGTIYLGVKYASNWAALAAMAPATAPAGLNPDSFSLEPARDVPVMIVQGDNDTLVPVEGTRRWIDKMKELDMTYEYIENPGGTHGSVMTSNTSDIFAFFAEHSK